MSKEPKMSKEAQEGINKPDYTVKELVERLATMPEEKLSTMGIVPRLMLTRYIRELERNVSCNCNTPFLMQKEDEDENEEEGEEE